MERTVDSGLPKKIRWKKVGGGSLRILNKIIKPGEIFLAYPDEIPAAFKDTVVALDEYKEEPVTPVEAKKTVYSVVPRGKSKSLFDVVDENGKKINEAAIPKATADKLVEDLSK